MKIKNLKIGVVGLGNVGNALKHSCEFFYEEVFGFDIIGKHDWKPIARCDIVFVCVPTPRGSDGRLDCSCVDDVLDKLDNDHYKGIVAIKSTLRIGFMERACNQHPNLRFVYNPEFLREKSALQWTIDPDRIVVSGTPEDAKRVASVYVWAENAKTIITEYRSAEIGKLAHNARIATMVSYTNETERISKELGANVEDVMEIVTSDRRIGSKEHLIPNLGYYAGKCVPKDTEELMTVSNSEFLKVVEKVNEETKLRYGQRSKSQESKRTRQDLRIVAIIPTKSRPIQLEQAITAVTSQTQQPDELIVVGEEEQDFPANRKAIEDKFVKTKVNWVLNGRTKGLSGAINTAVHFLVTEATDPMTTYLALLDDDDTWEPEYLETACRQATTEGKDLVISGLIRHDLTDDKGTKQRIPKRLNQKMFLEGNPHIQGSNLFVRMSRLLEAGGFDEHLPSTTDRDFMIRLLDLGNVSYACIPRHLVHHHATSQTRLSTFGSTAKVLGLTRFLRKYEPRMTQEERLMFEQRATSLFGWKENLGNKLEQVKPAVSELPTSKESYNIHLVIGFTVSHLSCATKLLQDLNNFKEGFPSPISIVILDNTEVPDQLQQLVMGNKSGFSNVRLVPKAEVERDADAGKLGTYYTPKERRKGSSYGRTTLHRFLYLAGLGLKNPVFWILDDDVRLDKIIYASNYQAISPLQFKQIVDYLLEKRIAISVGGVTGDPPLPIASSIRGQLLELHSHLNSRKKSEDFQNQASLDASASQFPDQYYDLSIGHYDHLETPVRTSTGSQDFDILQSLSAILEGRNQLRPALAHTEENSMRGGNTIVTDIECLRTHINSSPRINGIELRRGDTSWVELNRYIGGELVGRENKRIISLPLFVRQERAPAFKPKLLSDSLAADLLGGAFVRAFKNLIKERNAALMKTTDIGAMLAFSEEDCRVVIEETKQNLEERISILTINAWRIRGLVSTIRHQIENHSENIASSLSAQQVQSLHEVLNYIQRETSEQNVVEFCQRLKIGLDQGITEYMLEHKRSRQQFSSNLDLEATEEQQKEAQKLIRKHFHAETLVLIGQGQEGLVYSDGVSAYKYFISNRIQKKVGLLNLIREKLLSASPKRIIAVEEVIEEENQVLLKMPLVEGHHYKGGLLTEILEFLRECRETGIVTTNIWPENLIVGKEGLVYVDIGRSIASFTETLFNEMCKRAYLTYRWHFRTDLKDLLTRSLYEPNMPELFGFDEFKKALELLDVHSQMDACLVNECLKSKPKRILDYGCGTGSTADKLAENGCQIDCYDPDSARFKQRPHKQNVTLLTEDELTNRIGTCFNYDVILCNLVLCSIESESEVERVLRRLRSLALQNGRVIVGLCNPLSDDVPTSPSQKRGISLNAKYTKSYPIVETTLKGNQRTDWHRPINWYINTAHKASLELEKTLEVPSEDVERLSPSSDQILLVLRPVQEAKQAKTVSLMIKASAMEWQTIEKQVKHVVSQLEGPQQFVEKILVTDSATEGFARQYAAANLEKFHEALQNLLKEHVIGQVFSAPANEKEIKRIYRNWFSVECSKPRASNGQPTYMTLFGLEQCKGDYVLQTDSDCIFFRKSRDHDYLKEMVNILEKDQTAVTIALPIPHEETQPFTRTDESGKPFRAEVRCCLINMAKLKSMLPLSNETQNNQLKLPWHRSLDRAIAEGKAASYRGGNPQTCFMHTPNFRKSDINDWMNVIDAAETGVIISQQLNKVQLTGEAADWLGKRNEQIIILLRGKDVPLSKVRRCIASLQVQSFKDWAAVIVDAGSQNGIGELYRYVFKPELDDKVTLVRNHVPMSPMENIDYVTSSICQNPTSVIVHLDLDDALIGADALTKVKEEYDNGADVTVGSMLRTDKQIEYEVNFENPRVNRGGNVWQHLRTYRKYLYDRVPKDYFQIDGEWVKHSEDWAFMIPIVELAKNPVHIEEKIYFYEPSEDKALRDIQEREKAISKIIAKPSLEARN